MAKKKGKRVDPEKKAALQARKEAKAEKKTQKRLAKQEDGSLENANDFDSLLEAYRSTNSASSNQPQVLSLEGFPPARANATLTLVEGQKATQAYLFGGEYYDGVENIVLDHLYRVDIQQQQCEWRQIISPVGPPSRCAHSCVYYNQHLYVFGGERANQDEYHHYRDLWKFSIQQNAWTEIKAGKNGTTPPTSRSGHVARVWKHFMIVFGGFFEAQHHEPIFYNDVHVFNLQTEQWMTIPHSKLSARPEPRSACNAAVLDEDGGGSRLVVHGGFSKLSKALLKQQQQGNSGGGMTNDVDVLVSETKTHTDAWVLQLAPLLKDQPPTWERLVSSSTRAQQQGGGILGRAGMASIGYKSRLLAFGGVQDRERLNHQMKSVFFNNLFSLDVEQRKWYPMTVHGGGQQSNEEDEKVDEDGEKSGWDLDKLKSNLFAFVDSSGNVVYEKQDETKEEEDSDEDDSPRRKPAPKVKPSSAVMTLNPVTNVPEAVRQTEPLPRINACIIVSGHTLYLYSGLLEVGDREVTLDDLWKLDLKKRTAWECLWAGSMHQQVWRGAVHDDNDSYYSSTAGGDDGDSDFEEEKVEEMDSEDDEVAIMDPREKAKARSATIKQEIASLNEKYHLEDDNRTPRPNEVLSDFYERTSDHWKNEIDTKDELSAKETKRQSFGMAKDRFDELEPVLERLQNLMLERKSLKDSSKKEKKSKKKDKS